MSGLTCHLNHPLSELHFSLPFVCCICSSFNAEYSSAFNGLQCKKCAIKICPSCIISYSQDKAKRNKFYLDHVKISLEYFYDELYELSIVAKDAKNVE